MLIHWDPKIFSISKKKSKFIKKTEFTKREPIQKIILKWWSYDRGNDPTTSDAESISQIEVTYKLHGSFVQAY